MGMYLPEFKFNVSLLGTPGPLWLKPEQGQVDRGGSHLPTLSPTHPAPVHTLASALPTPTSRARAHACVRTQWGRARTHTPTQIHTHTHTRVHAHRHTGRHTPTDIHRDTDTYRDREREGMLAWRRPLFHRRAHRTSVPPLV